MLWGILGLISLIVVIGYLILVANMVWVLYRVVLGWLKLHEGVPVHNYRN